MSFVQFAFIILTTVALAVGQVLFKVAARTFQTSPAHWLENFLNVRLLLALAVYFIATVMWLLVLKVTPLRIAYPFAALAFVLVPLLAHFFLRESLTWNTFAGAALIALGVWVSVSR
jgi:drug/metabolite transporter (DMT)-like permease